MGVSRRALSRSQRTGRALLVCGVALLPGCGRKENQFGTPPLPMDGGDTDGDTDGIGGGGGGGGVPAHCRVGGDGDGDTDGTDAGETGGDFKFDTAPPPGGDGLPPTCEEVVATRTNLGCTFWAVDLPNDSRGTDFSPPAADQQFAVVIANSSALLPAAVEVFEGDASTPVASATIAPDQTHTFQLPALSVDALAPSTDGVAYRIESDVPVTAYQFNPLDNSVPVYSNDASVLLPAHALADDYTAVTAHAIMLAMSATDTEPVLAPAFVSVVAALPDTTVTVSPLGELQPGPTSQTLAAGQVYTVMSTLGSAAAPEDLSGTRITADGPVAVFAGNVATALPRDAGACCADHIEQQMVPTAAWGTSYVAVPPPSASEGDDLAEYRIMAAFDGTELLYCPSRPPGAPATLDAGGGVVFDTSLPFTVTTADPDQPILVTQYLLSQQALEGADTSPDVAGDPAMLVLPARAQYEQKTVVAVPQGYARNYILIYGPHTEVLLDGEPIAEDAWSETGVLDGEAMRHVRVPVDNGSHIIESSAPVGVSVMGFDEAVSFGYPGGTGVRAVAPVPPVG